MSLVLRVMMAIAIVSMAIMDIDHNGTVQSYAPYYGGAPSPVVRGPAYAPVRPAPAAWMMQRPPLMMRRPYRRMQMASLRRPAAGTPPAAPNQSQSHDYRRNPAPVRVTAAPMNSRPNVPAHYQSYVPTMSSRPRPIPNYQQQHPGANYQDYYKNPDSPEPSPLVVNDLGDFPNVEPHENEPNGETQAQLPNSADLKFGYPRDPPVDYDTVLEPSGVFRDVGSSENGPSDGFINGPPDGPLANVADEPDYVAAWPEIEKALVTSPSVKNIPPDDDSIDSFIPVANSTDPWPQMDDDSVDSVAPVRSKEPKKKWRQKSSTKTKRPTEKPQFEYTTSTTTSTTTEKPYLSSTQKPKLKYNKSNPVDNSTDSGSKKKGSKPLSDSMPDSDDDTDLESEADDDSTSTIEPTITSEPKTTNNSKQNSTTSASGSQNINKDPKTKKRRYRIHVTPSGNSEADRAKQVAKIRQQLMDELKEGRDPSQTLDDVKELSASEAPLAASSLTSLGLGGDSEAWPTELSVGSARGKISPSISSNLSSGLPSEASMEIGNSTQDQDKDDAGKDDDEQSSARSLNSNRAKSGTTASKIANNAHVEPINISRGTPTVINSGKTNEKAPLIKAESNSSSVSSGKIIDQTPKSKAGE